MTNVRQDHQEGLNRHEMWLVTIILLLRHSKLSLLSGFAMECLFNNVKRNEKAWLAMVSCLSLWRWDSNTPLGLMSFNPLTFTAQSPVTLPARVKTHPRHYPSFEIPSKWQGHPLASHIFDDSTQSSSLQGVHVLTFWHETWTTQSWHMSGN